MKKVLHVHDDKHKVLKQLQANQIEDLTVLDIKNGSTMCKNQHPRPIKQSMDQQGLQLINRFHNMLKHAAVSLTRFPTPEECFPKQFFHPNRRDATISSITH